MTHASPTTLYESLVALGTSPALVWYGEDGRTELSGKVFANHVAKIANYLEQECDLFPGNRIVLDLPPHWKALTWALGGLVAGGFVVVGREKVDDGEPGTIIVTNEPAAVSADDPGDLVVALNLDSFGFAWEGDLPDGVADGTADVMGQADALLVEGVDGDSNYSFWAHVLHDVPTTDRVVVKDATLSQAIALTYLAFEREISVVFVADGRDAAEVAAAEKGTVLEL
ncbi:TIGR03089 family protein [Trueperella bialowiezensis]|uniref:TIGR03089 family protein n=1 Tax=Trueperella bialowiezensis TaxID=312285 RepID=A0A448PDB3_9ACTO|nr:TIGR03089 family protein [Trueperella bialowiezensis]VEI12905.1 Uncharacterised protein [Trueperella bialowiezensis]